MKSVRLSENQKKVLSFFQEKRDDLTYFFDYISKELNMEKKIVRMACRALKKKGLLEFSTCWDEYENIPSGSGYMITYAGRSLKF